jgi:drug/metabolite transporter (DMT)-like permease
LAVYYLLMVLSVAVAAVSQLLLKKSADAPHASLLHEYLNPYVAAGYALLFGSTLLTIGAFRGIAYKNAPVIESLGYLFVLILSRAFLGEHVTKRRLAGNLLIIAGILIFYL